MEINATIFNNTVITHVALSAKWAAGAFIIMQLVALFISLWKHSSGKLRIIYN